MTFSDRDFINGDLFQVLEFKACKAFLKGSLLNFLDRVPTDSQMIGHIFNGHVFGQFQDIAFKRSGVASAWICESDIDLSYNLANQTRNALQWQADPNRFLPDRQAAKAASYFPAQGQIPGSANRAAQMVGFVGDREMDFTAYEISSNVVVSAKTESVVEKAGGHGRLLSSDQKPSTTTQPLKA